MRFKKVWVAKHMSSIKVFTTKVNIEVASEFFSISNIRDIEIIEVDLITYKDINKAENKLRKRNYINKPLVIRPIEAILPERICYYLKLEGIKTIGDLAESGREKVKSFWKIGRSSIEAIDEKMEDTHLAKKWNKID